MKILILLAAVSTLWAQAPVVTKTTNKHVTKTTAKKAAKPMPKAKAVTPPPADVIQADNQRQTQQAAAKKKPAKKAKK